MTVPAPTTRVLSRGELARAGTIAPEAAARQWQEAMARPDDPGRPALVALMEDWAAFSGLSYPDMLTAILAAQEQADEEWHELSPASAEEVARFYDESSTILPLLLWWHGTTQTPARAAATAASAFAAVGARRVLDFGCGIGSTALVLATRGFDVTVADVSRPVMSFAQERLKARGHDVEAIDLMERPLESLPDTGYDAIVSFDVLEHVPDAPATLRELDRRLNPGGVLCINQVYVPEERDEPQHYPQDGSLLLQLHESGYRTAHVPDVAWLAQKAALSGSDARRQELELRARVGLARTLGPRTGPIGRRLAFHVLRRAVS